MSEETSSQTNSRALVTNLRPATPIHFPSIATRHSQSPRVGFRVEGESEVFFDDLAVVPSSSRQFGNS
jgi:hypothetical protein